MADSVKRLREIEVVCWLREYSFQSFRPSYRLDVVDFFDNKPYCLRVIMSLSRKYSSMLDAITRSITLHATEVKDMGR